MKEDRYILLLYKQLNGEISAKESEELSQWRQLSEENEQNARSVELAWQASAPNLTVPEVDLDQEFGRLLQRSKIEGHLESSGTEKRLFPIKRSQWLAIAAGLALLLSFGWWMNNNVSLPANEQWVEISTDQNTREVILADGSQLKLNQNTTIRYREGFGSNPERILQLEGEAFFDVSHDATKAFLVETEGATVRVLGTEFNVKAYAEQSKTEVYLSSGQVQVSLNSTNETIDLKPGEVIIYDRVEKSHSPIMTAAAVDLSWLNRRLVFDNTPLKEGLAQIELAFRNSID